MNGIKFISVLIFVVAIPFTSFSQEEVNQLRIKCDSFDTKNVTIRNSKAYNNYIVHIIHDNVKLFCHPSEASQVIANLNKNTRLPLNEFIDKQFFEKYYVLRENPQTGRPDSIERSKLISEKWYKVIVEGKTGYLQQRNNFELEKSYGITIPKEEMVIRTFFDDVTLFNLDYRNSGIVTTIPFNTRFTVTGVLQKRIEKPTLRISTNAETGKRDTIFSFYSVDEYWYKVDWNGKEGYLNNKDVSMLKNISNVLATEVSGNHFYSVRLKSYDPEVPGKAVDSIQFFRSHGHRIKEIETILKPSHRIIHYETFRQACPGSNTIQLIHLNENNCFEPIISSNLTGEVYEYEENAAYLPTKDSLGRIIFVHLYYLDQLNSEYMKEFDLTDYRGKIDFPLSQLIIKQSLVELPVYDEDHNEVLNKDGSVKIKRTVGKPEFFRWTGEQTVRPDM